MRTRISNDRAGSQGERHYHVNGHDGPFDPPMSLPDSAAPVSRRVSRDRATKWNAVDA